MAEENESERGDPRFLFAISVRMGAQLLTVYENIVGEDLDKLSDEIRQGVLEHKLIQCATEDGARALFMVGAGMEVKVWPQADFTKWLEDNERKQQKAMMEQRALMMGGGAPQMVSPILVPGGGPRR